jgi:glycosyltransferase involved in cell wall biosynthesis
MKAERDKVSAFIICFNEEDHIEECIKSVSFCDEIIVVDSFSKDRTVELATALGVKVLQRKWTGYIDQKAFGLENSRYEWVINLDADERVSLELKENIIKVLEASGQGKAWPATKHKEGQGEINGFYINRVVYFLGRWWRQGGWYPEYRLRFFKKSKVTWGGVEPHERPIVNGAADYLEGEIHHFTYENMDEQFQRLHNFSSIASKEDFRAGKRAGIFSIVFNPILRVLKFFIVKKGYREGIAGLIVAVAEGYYTFMKYAKLWELEFLEKERKKGGLIRPKI